jgi:type II secretory pathway component PulF
MNLGFEVEKEKHVSILGRFEAGSESEQFVENLALLLASGLDVVSAFSAMKREVKSGGMRQVISQMESSLESGKNLSSALEGSGLFGTNVIALVKIGEETGKLPDNLRVVALQLQKERSFRGKIASAMLYPVFVVVLTLIIGISTSWLILPRLADVFSSLQLKLPLITEILISFGRFLGAYGLVFVPSFVVAVLLLAYFIFINSRTKFIGQELLFAFPGIKELVSGVELSRFGFMMGNLLSAGLPVVIAFDSLIEVTSFHSYRRLYRFLRDRVDEGNSFAKSFAMYPGIDRLMPPSIQQMIVAAEQSGFLADALIKIGVRYEEKTDMTAKNLSTVLEPALLVLVWFGVAFVALAVILPIYSLVGGFTSSSSGVTETAVTTTIPTPTITPSVSPPSQGGERTVLVSETGIGYLNIREDPSTAARIVGRAIPGEVYQFLDKTEEEDWYLIVFDNTNRGWVNATYVEEIQ